MIFVNIVSIRWFTSPFQRGVGFKEVLALERSGVRRRNVSLSRAVRLGVYRRMTEADSMSVSFFVKYT